MKTYLRFLSLILVFSIVALSPTCFAESNGEESISEDVLGLLEEGSEYEYGDSGANILALQKQLRELGYLTDEPTGILDDATQDALETFRLEHSSAANAAFIGNKKSKKFHFPDCDSVREMKESNKISFSTSQEATNAGYVPCKRCNPPTS